MEGDVRVLQNDLRSSGVLVEVVVSAIQDERNGVVAASVHAHDEISRD